MIRNIFYLIYFCPLVLSTLLWVLLPYYVCKILGLHGAANAVMYGPGRLFHRMVIGGTGSKVEVRGLSNLPTDTKRICFISNHQSYFDIPLIFGYLPIMAGFVAKKEVKKVPLLNLWTMALGSVLIDRKNARAAIESITRGVEYIKEGHPLVIFPEGTRSRSDEMNSFKAGALKLAFRSKAVIVPLTVRNTNKLFENNGNIEGAEVVLTVHPPVQTVGLEEEKRKELAGVLERTVRSALPQS